MSESVVKASFCIDRRLLSEVERLRNFKNCGRFAGRPSQVKRKTHFPIVQSLLKQPFKLMMVLRLLKIPKTPTLIGFTILKAIVNEKTRF